MRDGEEYRRSSGENKEGEEKEVECREKRLKQE